MMMAIVIAYQGEVSKFGDKVQDNSKVISIIFIQHYALD